jgi:hypothetical protein
MLPGSAVISAQVHGPATDPRAYRFAHTSWRIDLGRFQLLVHLSTQELSGLKSGIDWQTKSDVVTPPITVNDLFGVTHGGYGQPRTWIDWWFKKGDITLCLCLQSNAFPVTVPTEAEIAEHAAIIASIKYSRDFPNEPPPHND